MAGANQNEKPLRKIAEAFKDLDNKIDSQTLSQELEVASFSSACSLVSPLFGCLGIAFKFAEMDYVAKVVDLAEASKSIATLQSMIDRDVEANCVKKGGSHSRNLLRVKRGLDMVRLLFEQILTSEGNSLKGPASTAYAKVFAPYHGWAIRKAVAAGMYALPTKAQLLRKLNEDETSARIHMQEYVTSSAPLILYIDNLFISRDLGLDW
ncbi:accelerated cell death 11 [Impatiens glandulifera]|uniref:accelerated cell death 11 n=1 Tax=Impatiens glandulifera TaxID=253017 RepID=UPI001FB11323|nr:accelerated cell death 11 [Impatiens glandulifera]